VVYTVTEMLPGNTITWKDLSSDELMAVTPGQQVTIGIAWDEATQTFTFSADDNSDTYEHTGAVRPPLTDWKTVTARANLTADDTTQTFTWTAVPEAVRYRLRIYNAHGSQIWQGYPSTNAYTVPPGVLEPNAMYKYRVEAWNSHSPINLDNLSKIPASSNDNYVFYTPDTEAVDPMVELDNGGVELWSSSYLGDNTSFWIKVHDAQGVPDNIQNVTVTLPDGTRQTLYHDDGNRYNTSTSGIYRGGYYGTPQSGVYTFSVADRDGNTDDLTENFTANAIDYPAEVSLTPAQGTLLNDTGADFDWEDVADTAFYRLELIDKNYNRVYAFGTETSDYTLDPGFLKTDAHYRWRVTTWREFFDENIDNASTSPWGRYDNGLNFHTTAAAGTSRPVLDLEDIGVTTQHVVFAGTDRTFYRLYFHAKVTDADGVPENIRQVVVTYPDGVTTLSLKLDEVKADNQATYWGQAAFTDPADIPEGRYTFTVTDHDDRTGQLTDDLVVNVLPIPDGLTPGRDGSVSGTAATLGWNTVEGAVEYRARLFDGWDGTLHWSAFITGNSYDIPADLLEIEKTYGFRIYAYREPGSSGDVDNMSLNSFMYGAIHRFTTGAASPDLDGDGTPDASDNCPANPDKVDPGVCGCDAGEDIGDSDGDGTPNCLDACPDDAAKTEPGQCGCGIADTDRDGDTLADCVDLYPDNPLNIPDPVSPGDDAVITETDAIVLEAEGFNPVGDVTHVHTHWLVKRADDPEAVYDVLSAVDLESHALTAALDPGLKYAWQAGYEDSEGNISWSEESYFSVGTPEQNEAVQVSSGIDIASYRMVSFVQWPTDPSSEAVLGDDMAEDYEGNYRIGRYDPMTGGYIEHGHGLTIEPGRSYWLLARTGLATEVDGVPVSLNHDIYVALDYNTDTGDGWNMVGSPNEAVYEWGSVEVVVYDDDGNVAFGPMAVKYLSEDNPYVDTRLWRWNAGAYAAERPGDATEPVMHVYQGYWVKAKHANVHLKFGVDAQEALLTQKQSLWDKMVAGVRSWMENTGLISSEAIAGDGDTPPMPMGSVDDPDNMLPVAGCFVETTKR